MNRTLLISLFIFFITASCEQREGNPVGACVHHYEDPILAIESVNDANSGEQISEITITDVRIDSVSKKVSSLVQESSKNVAVEDSSIVCEPPADLVRRQASINLLSKHQVIKTQPSAKKM